MIKKYLTGIAFHQDGERNREKDTEFWKRETAAMPTFNHQPRLLPPNNERTAGSGHAHEGRLGGRRPPYSRNVAICLR